jgi:O-antigen ligase
MNQRITNKVIAWLEPIYPRVGLVLIGIMAIVLSGYLMSVRGSIVLKIIAALVLAVIIFQYRFVGLLLFVGMIPLESAFLSIAGGAATYTLLLGAYLFALWVLQLFLDRRQVELMPYAKWMLPFVIWAGASILWAMDRRLSLQYWLTLFQMFALSLLVYNQVVDRRRLNMILMVLLVSSGVAVTLGYFQLGTLIGYNLLTLQSVGAKEYASIVGLAFLSGIILFFFEERKRRAVLPIFITILSIYPLFAAGERGVILAILVALLTLVVIEQRRRAFFAYAGLAVLVLYGVFLVVIRNGWVSGYIISRFSVANIIETGGTGRTDIWRVGWQIVRDHPLIGVGIGNFEHYFYQYAHLIGPLSNFTGSTPHNDILSVTSEMGVVGLFFFLTLLITQVIRLRGAFWKRHDPEMHILAKWLMGLFIYFVMVGMTSVYMYRKLFWLVIVLVEVAIRISRRTRRQPVRVHSRSKQPVPFIKRAGFPDE